MPPTRCIGYGSTRHSSSDPRPIYLAIWIAVASLAKRRRYSGVASAIALVILTPTVSLAALDWLASREPDWIPGLYGPAFAVSQLLVAMSLALSVTLIRPGHPAMLQVESLRTALLALALLTAWTWMAFGRLALRLPQPLVPAQAGTQLRPGQRLWVPASAGTSDKLSHISSCSRAHWDAEGGLPERKNASRVRDLSAGPKRSSSASRSEA
jgi:hypothetical protein